MLTLLQYKQRREENIEAKVLAARVDFNWSGMTGGTSLLAQKYLEAGARERQVSEGE